MFKNFIKGIIVGMANILPGVSGGILMVSMGIYDKLIYCITHLLSSFKSNIKFLLPIFVGIIVALTGLPFLIEPAFEYYPLPTNCLFIGLILGGIPTILKRLKYNNKLEIKASYIFSFLAFVFLVIGTSSMGGFEPPMAETTINIFSFIKFFVLGIVIAATIVIPGVSGSMVLLVLGYYTFLLDIITDFITSVATMNIESIMECIYVLAPLGIGVIAGVFIIAKLVEIIFKKFQCHAYWAILGLTVASPVAILLVGEIGAITFFDFILSIITFIGGLCVALKLSD